MSGSGYGPAVVDGKLVYTSPSAAALHTKCKRRWFFKYVQKLPDDKPALSAEYGTQCHGRLEIYLPTGNDILGPAERAALDAGLVPPPSKDYLIEAQTFTGVPLLAAGVPIKGKADLIVPAEDGFTLTDWKTTSRLSNKDTTPASLVDPHNEEGRQMLAYAEWGRLNWSGPLNWVVLRHVQIQVGKVTDEGGTLVASGPFKANEVKSAPITPDAIASAWRVVESEYVEPMKATAAAKSVEDIEGNGDMCAAGPKTYWKACPYESSCPKAGRKVAPSALQTLFGVKPPEKPMSIMDRLKTVSTTPTPAPVPPALITTQEAVAMLDAPTMSPAAQVQLVTDLLNPPSEDIALAPVEDKPARGRPKGAKNRSRDPEAYEKETSPPSMSLGTAYISTSTTAPAGVKLYFNCHPPYRSLYEYTLELEKKALAAFGETVPDIRLSEAKGLSFMKWRAVLGQLAKESPPPPSTYVVFHGEDERVDAVAAALAGMYPEGVVRGGGR